MRWPSKGEPVCSPGTAGDAKSKLVGLCEAVRPFGRKATPEQMKEIEDAAMALREVAAGSRYDGREIEESWLQGTHDMLYNTNEGPGGGRFGPILAAELSQTIEGYPGRMTLRGVIVPWLFRRGMRAGAGRSDAVTWR